jgi:hypothetical protein
MSEKKTLRNCLFVDPQVQVPLVCRVTLYWSLCFFGMFFTLLGWQVLTGTKGQIFCHVKQVLHAHGPVLVALGLSLPLFLIDVVRWSNRFVGPMLRLRRSMRELARGNGTAPMQFRKGDYWPEIADEFNAIRAKTLDATASHDAATPQKPPEA